MNNAIYTGPGQNMCLPQSAFHTNSEVHLPEVIMSTKKYGHLKKVIFYIARKNIVQKCRV